MILGRVKAASKGPADESGTKGQLRRDYFWNSASSLMFSASSVLMLLVVTRWLGLAAAGVFALATAIGQQLQTLGAFEVRPYQATDVRHQFSFGEYFAARMFTISLMAVGIVIYAYAAAQPGQAALLIALIASFRIMDAFEDVFYSEFQRDGRLDIGGRTNFYRVALTTLSFVVAVYATRDLMWSTVIALFVAVVSFLLIVLPQARRLFRLRPDFDWRAIFALLLTCAPLFGSAFLATYLINAPRFAIERFLDAEQQGVYAILFMPAFAINLLTMLVFRPLLTHLANAWNQRDLPGFNRLVIRGLSSVVAASAVTLVFTFFYGVPVLDFLYDVSLGSFKRPLLVLVLAGAFNAVGVVFYYALTTIRQQRVVLIGYLAAAVVAFLSSVSWVPRLAITGAAYSFAASMLILAALFGVALLFFMLRALRGWEKAGTK